MTLDTNKISTLGFGCMRLIGHETDSIDIDQFSKMVDHYLEAGGNYFDTAWAYPNSEAALNKALISRHPRETYYIADKCVAWMHCESQADLEKQLQESLAALGTDYIDVYLMHNLGGTRTAFFEKYDAWNFLKSAKERGLVKHIGFSAHCTPEELTQLINDYPDAEVIQLQVNYADWDNPSWRERECVQIVNEAGIPLVVMEPVKGGILADPPAAVKATLDKTYPGKSYASFALRFSASRNGVATVLSGMNTLEMVEDNCQALMVDGPLTAADEPTIAQVLEDMTECSMVPCTGCNYCAKVCPEGIGISQSLSVLNFFDNLKDAAKAAHQLNTVVVFNGGKKHVTECIECHTCEDVCPQDIDILNQFQRIKTEIMPYSEKPVPLIK